MRFRYKRLFHKLPRARVIGSRTAQILALVYRTVKRVTDILHTDGAARGNPGPAAIGVVISDPGGKEIEAFGEVIGHATNNEAEYRALLRGLERAAVYGDIVEIRTDNAALDRGERVEERSNDF